MKKILRGSVGTRQPARGQIYLTARSGSADLQRLARLRVGDAVQIRTGQSGVLPFREGRPGIGKPNSLIGVSSAILRDRENRARCGARDELLRPRSALGWAANGDMIVATASGRATVGGVRSGGATAHQWVSYLKQLGAVNAVNLDGGTSTTLLVRRSVGGKLQRLDRSAGDYQRPVPDVLTFRVP